MKKKKILYNNQRCHRLYYFHNKKWNGSYSLDWAQYNVAMVIIWIEIYRFLSPFVRDGEDRREGKHQDQGSRENESFPPPTEIVLDQLWDEGCTVSIPGDGWPSFSVGLICVRRVIGIQSNIAEKLFTNETPLSANVPLLHQEGRDWARMQSGELWTRTLTPGN